MDAAEESTPERSRRPPPLPLSLFFLLSSTHFCWTVDLFGFFGVQGNVSDWYRLGVIIDQYWDFGEDFKSSTLY